MKGVIVITFFVCVIIVIIVSLASYKGDTGSRLADGVLTEEATHVEKKRLELEQEKLNLEVAKIQEKRKQISFWQRFTQASSIGTVLAVLTAILIVAWGLYHKYSVHDIQIGKHSRLKVRYKDLGTLGIVQNGLVLSEQLKSHAKTEEKAFEMSLKLSDVVTQQLRALAGRYRHASLIDVTPEQSALPIHVPTFAELLHTGDIAPTKPIIFGYRKDTGIPETGPLKRQYSIFTIGLPGFGKTTHAVYFIASAILAEQASFDVLDLHFPDSESLGYQLGDLVNTPFINLVTNPFDLPDVLEAYQHELETRAQQPKDRYRARILVVDEHETWMKHVKALAEAESTIISQGRKFKLYVLIISKSAKTDKLGGDSDIKNQCTTSYCFRTSKPTAQLFFRDKEKERLVSQLKDPGECVFTDWKNNSCIVAIPFTTRRDMTTLVDLIVDGNVVRKIHTLPEDPRDRPELLNRSSNTHHPIIRQNPELEAVDRLFDDLAKSHQQQEKNNVVEFPKKVSPDPRSPMQEPPSPELVLELLKANCEASPLTKSEWLQSFSQQCGVSESLLKKILLGYRTLTPETIEKVLPYLMQDVHRTPEQP